MARPGKSSLFGKRIILPHYIFNDAPTLYSQRMGEISIELIIFFIITVVQVLLLRKLYTRIRMLEGFLLVCANCKKIKNQEEHWEQMENIYQNILMPGFLTASVLSVPKNFILISIMKK